MLPGSYHQTYSEEALKMESERYWGSSQTPGELSSCSSSQQHHLLSMAFKNDFHQEMLQAQGDTGVNVYSGNANSHVLPQQLHFDEEQGNTELVPAYSSITEAQAKQEMLAYQALCQAEVLRSEKTPQRTQFQRENHILAERQRREEMNEKFTALKALLPKSTKKDKASIVGETINYVLELEKKLKQLKSAASERNLHRHKRRALYVETDQEGKLASASNSSATDQGESHLRSKPADIELQTLGAQSVIKMICMRSPGLALRILATLEDCKAQVIQSNIATLGSHAILFFTVEFSPATSTNTDHLIQALQEAATHKP